MREIKFRGKTRTTEGNKWVFGHYYRVKSFFDNNEGHYISTIRNDHLQDYSIDENTIGQYTGLKDKNGKEIYEGDILQQIHYKFSNDEYGHKGFKKTIIQVFWDSKMAGFVFKVIKKTDTEMPKNYTEPYREVIGNIYDNPELLKEEHK